MINQDTINEFVKSAEDKLRELSKKYPNTKDLSELPFENETMARFCLDVRGVYGKMIDRQISYDAEMERQSRKAVI